MSAEGANPETLKEKVGGSWKDSILKLKTMIHEPLTRINSNEYEAIKKICSGSILLNCAINKGALTT